VPRSLCSVYAEIGRLKLHTAAKPQPRSSDKTQFPNLKPQIPQRLPLIFGFWIKELKNGAMRNSARDHSLFLNSRVLECLSTSCMSVLVVGSIGIDSIKTQLEERRDVLGGAASYASIGASFFAPVKLVGIVGSDFPQEYIELFNSRGINLDGVQVVDGKTFRWSGEYEWDMNQRKTLSLALNVFENFTPKLPDAYKRTPIILLGNISPVLQYHVLDQVEDPRFVVADTMDLWITTTRPELLDLLERVDLLVLNDSEARQLTAETSLIKAGRNILRLGPRFVAIKKGEHGCLLLSQDQFFSCGAFPLEDIHDPTGAGRPGQGTLLLAALLVIWRAWKRNRLNSPT
jgi:cytidine kinase